METVVLAALRAAEEDGGRGPAATAYLRKAVSRATGGRSAAANREVLPEGLDRLRAAGHRLGVATPKVSRSAHALLAATGILDRFDTVVCHDMVARGKPHPEMGLRALAGPDAGPAASWYLGDTATDMRMARAAGMRALGVSYGVDGGDVLTAAGTGSRLGLTEHRLPPRPGAPPHFHRELTGMFYVAQGDVLLTLGTERRLVGPDCDAR
jgi:phosphoglycolate phosphatase-like HAD superfamily hydrolase